MKTRNCASRVIVFLIIIAMVVSMMAGCSYFKSRFKSYYGKRPCDQSETRWISEDGNIVFSNILGCMTGEMIVNNQTISISVGMEAVSLEVYLFEDRFADNLPNGTSELVFQEAIEKWEGTFHTQNCFSVIVKKTTYFQEGQQIVFHRVENWNGPTFSDGNKTLIELADTVYSHETLNEIARFEGNVDQLHAAYPIQCIRTIKGAMAYRVVYRGEEEVATLVVDDAGEVILGKVHSLTQSEDLFQEITLGQPLQKVQESDPDGEYLLSYAGMPKVSLHYRKDCLIVIHYSNSNLIEKMEKQII